MEAHGQPLRGLRWAGGASLPFLRTEMPLRDIPVFRMAYFTIKPYYGLISKTLMLQVRSAHPPMPHRNVFSKHPGVPLGLFSDSAPTHLRCAGVPLGLFGKPKRSSFSRVRGLHQAILWPLLQNARPPGSPRSPSDAAPKCFFKTSRCSARLIFRFRTDPPSVRRCSAWLIQQAETLELQPLRGLRWAGGASLPPAPPSPAALRIRDGQLQRLPLRGAGAQRLKGGCAMAMRSSAG